MQVHLRRFILFLLAVIFAVAFAGAPAFSQEEQQEDKTLAPYFLVQGDPNVDHLPLKDTRVEISVSGVIADVKVRQIYRNEGPRPINASYVFPASTRAAVYAMRMQLGNEIIVAKIKEREQAKKEFDQAKQEGKSASLLEQQRPNVFSMSLANIMPQEQVEIELRYTELVVPTDNIYELVFPTVVGTRYAAAQDAKKENAYVQTPYLRQGKKPTSELHVTARIAAGLPIYDLSCPSHKIVPQWQANGVAQLTLDDSDPFQGNRDFVLRYRLAGDQIASGLLLFQGADENFFLYMAQPPQRVATDSMPPREYIFVVDVSGSMSGFPLETSKQLLRDLIGNLRPTDLFNVILFAGDSTVLSPQSLAANEQNIAAAIALIDQQRGSGGTELLAAMQQAMSLPRQAGISRSLLLLTDGFVAGEQGVFEHIRQNLNQCNVFAFGIGTSVNHYLIEGVAKAGMAEPFVVTTEAEAAGVANKFREYVQSPVLTDIQVRSIGFDTYDVNPVKFPDLLAQRPIILFGKWRGAVSGTIELTGKNGHGLFTSRLDVATTQPDQANGALRYLWARSRIAELSDYGAYQVDDENVKTITALGLQYNLLTRYTSFIAVREVVTNPSGSAEDVKQALPLPLRVSNLAVGGGTEVGSEPELIWLIASVLLLGTLVIVFKRSSGFARKV
ncbi:MAG TPA: VIT and VWA domain-containing protein [Pyrinomonadaceae bacterium]|nr:VIT and VWA domain-containing protein [Pyrinomonadaceae bacterium]